MYKITCEFLCKSLHCSAYKVRMKNGSMVFYAHHINLCKHNLKVLFCYLWPHCICNINCVIFKCQVRQMYCGIRIIILVTKCMIYT